MKLVKNVRPERAEMIQRDSANKYKATYRDAAGRVIEQFMIGSYMTAWCFCEKKTKDNPYKDFMLQEVV